MNYFRVVSGGEKTKATTTTTAQRRKKTPSSSWSSLLPSLCTNARDFHLTGYWFSLNDREHFPYFSLFPNETTVLALLLSLSFVVYACNTFIRVPRSCAYVWSCERAPIHSLFRHIVHLFELVRRCVVSSHFTIFDYI